MKNITIQNKAIQLKLELEDGLSQPLPFDQLSSEPNRVKVQLSHCYELIAATLGYRTHLSMKADDYEWDDHELFTERWRDDVYQNPRVNQAIVDRIKDLNSPSLKAAPGFIVTGIVQAV
ncbi:hypothetical protein, partial [Vibrio parahaemolyticus]|uniref:hypothetical protein n=1 Tax=Vibrio parahaemolyticus TaxID=670 RepID=UPI00146DF504